MAFPDQSFVEFLSVGERSSCGYCKNQRGVPRREEEGGDGIAKSAQEGAAEAGHVQLATSVSTGGAYAHQLLVEDYAGLLDLGWRRSGRYLYKPDNENTCCPQYTIRLDVTQFKLSRTQKRVMRQMNEFLATGKRPRCGVKEENPVEDQIEEKSPSKKEESKEPAAKKAKDAQRDVLKKKEIRNQKFEEKCRRQKKDPDAVRAELREKEAARRRTIRSYIDEARPDWLHKLEIQVVRPNTPACNERELESFELYTKYQEAIHNDTARFAGFRRFLCDSPLNVTKRNGVDFGAFHMWFLLDNKLIAVCVIDVLPKFLSAKYMYYDTDYSFLSLGTYTALREIEFTQSLHALSPAIQHYYMGFYIHSCPKMRYKAKFHPSDLLCDRTHKWLDFESCREILDASTKDNGYATFCPESPPGTPLDIDDMRVMTTGLQGVPIVTTFRRACVIHPEAIENEELLNKVRTAANLIDASLFGMIFYFAELNN